MTRKGINSSIYLIALVVTVLILPKIFLFINELIDDDDSPNNNGEIDGNIVTEQVKNMTLEEKIGQLLIAGVDGYSINNHTISMIENFHLGGIILFKKNIRSADQLLALINSIKNANKVNDIPLIFSVDEEGGRVSRLPNEINKLPSNWLIGEIDSKELSYEIGKILAGELKLFGFNMNFAPVLDINSNPLNPVIGDRAFGDEPYKVSRLGIETMKGIATNGVIPVVKHFPGHGDTGVDSHIGLPVIDSDLNRLNSFELIPFKEAIQNNADAIMIAHILLKRIDPQNPSSLSPIIITELLRNQLQFSGVIISDNMTMGAILKNYEIDEAAVNAIRAGSDVVLVCHEFENVAKVFNSLLKAVEDDIISEKRIDDSIYRIISLKNKYCISDTTISAVDITKVNERIAELDVYFKRMDVLLHGQLINYD